MLERNWWTDESQAQVYNAEFFADVNPKATDDLLRKAGQEAGLFGETVAQVDPMLTTLFFELIRNGIHALRSLMAGRNLDPVQMEVA